MPEPQIGAKVVRAIQRGDEGVIQAALDTLCTLMQVAFAKI